MEISNKYLTAKTWGSMFFIRIPGHGPASLLFWVKKGAKSSISLRIWKIKVSLELG